MVHLTLNHHRISLNHLMSIDIIQSLKDYFKTIPLFARLRQRSYQRLQDIALSNHYLFDILRIPIILTSMNHSLCIILSGPFHIILTEHVIPRSILDNPEFLKNCLAVFINLLTLNNQFAITHMLLIIHLIKPEGFLIRYQPVSGQLQILVVHYFVLRYLVRIAIPMHHLGRLPRHRGRRPGPHFQPPDRRSRLEGRQSRPLIQSFLLLTPTESTLWPNFGCQLHSFRVLKPQSLHCSLNGQPLIQ